MMNREESKEENYTFEFDDILERKGIAENLTELIENTKGSLVLAVDSKWGTGKTTFIKKWKNLLEDKEYQPLYFNAWENDDNDDPLLSLILLMEEGLNIDKLKDEGEKESKIKKYGKPLLKKGLPLVLKMVTNGLINIDGVDLGKFNEEQLIEFAGKIGGIELKKVKEEQNLKIEFKKSLEEFQQKQKNKIIIFIDELDRCRPTYAIELLERIKHLFDVQNYVFIISLDKTELGESLKMVYGNIDTDNYLKRFFDIEFYMPQPKVENYINFLRQKNNLSIQEYEDFFFTLKEMIIQIPNFRLRDCDKTFNIIKFSMNKIKEYPFFHYIFPYLIVVKVLENSYYKKLLNYDYILKSQFSNLELKEPNFSISIDFKKTVHNEDIFKTLLECLLISYKDERWEFGQKKLIEEIGIPRKEALIYLRKGIKTILEETLEFSNNFS